MVMQQYIENCEHSKKYKTVLDEIFGFYHITCCNPNKPENEKGSCWNCKLYKQKQN